jgi:formyl-CoA transferase
MDDKLPHPAGPLSDLRVIEMGTLIAGPFCGQLLGDFGAEIIKIEDPAAGDPMRQWGRRKAHGLSLWWPVIARNKKSVTVNLRRPEGQDLVRRLIAKADIVTENFRPGALEKWGLDYAALSRDHPALIMARVSGYGQTGPYRDRTGFGLIGEAMGGLRYVTGDPDRPPARAGISIGDSLAAAYAALGILMAVHHRERTGRGQMVDSALYEATLAMMENLVTEYSTTGYVRERSGAILPGIAPSNAYACADGESILIGANQDAIFARLCQAMGRPELADEPRFKTHVSRGEVQSELDRLIEAWTLKHRSETVLELMHDHGVPAGRIYRASDMLADPHFAAREAIIEAQHPVLGALKMQGTFPKLSATPGAVRWTGPELGEHNEEILGGLLGLSTAKLSQMKAEGVI